MAPVVAGEVNPAALEDLVRLAAGLYHLDHPHHPAPPAPDLAASPAPQTPAPPVPPGPADPGTPSADPPVPAGLMSREALQQAIIGKTTILLPHSWSAPDVR